MHFSSFEKGLFVQSDIIFLFSFVYPGFDFLLPTRRVFLEKQKTLTLPVYATGPCSKFLVESEVLIYFCYFVYIILFTLCPMLCMSVFHVWSLALDYIFFYFRSNLSSLDYSLIITIYIGNI